METVGKTCPIFHTDCSGMTTTSNCYIISSKMRLVRHVAGVEVIRNRYKIFVATNLKATGH